MIIVHVHHTFHLVIGGLEKAIHSISKELVKLGHEVHVVTSTCGAGGVYLRGEDDEHSLCA